ncbi:hypothetical protein SISNIDRAFT_489598 [Sistotremastrum niveocremeum HHB9708]|uniref:DUF6535 domain-containing protein n=1 Tax=Sistotremastrum niveocremeum HHB9708 TaxID=1314777 RepID=A0A164PQ93_9AGAM|nr:hypothetical protein SISNIDRAFT_489598 [Sistotremastrum niveocremeum HHB9708]
MSTSLKTAISSSEVLESSNAPRKPHRSLSDTVPTADPFDSPIFKRLLGLIEEQNEKSDRQNRSTEEQKEAILDIRRAVENLGRQMNGKGKGVVKGFQEADDVEMMGGRPSSVQMDGDLEMESPRSPVNETLQRLSTVIETVKDTLGNMKDTLLDHGKKFDVLIRDAIKDDQPYDQKELDDESTCTALFEMAMTKTKEEVDEWIKRMDVSLVFIALFSAVLTAFVVPATQNLFPSSNNTPGNPTDPPPPVPKISAQNVCVSYYLALVLAILDAVLSVLGRQWMSKLTNRPEGRTYKERLLRHLERERLAKPWLRLLVEGLHVLLLWSIGLFVTGLLYQLWNLGGSFEQHLPRLLVTWGLGIVLSVGILGVLLGASIHALVYEASPFGGPFNKTLLNVAQKLARSFKPWIDRVDRAAGWLENNRIRNRWLLWQILQFFVRATLGPLWLSSQLVDVWRSELEMDDTEKLLTTYMDLIAEASDPKLLERAVASFSYVEWFQNRDQSQEELARMKKTWDRLTATDTSLRVRETLTARARQFVPSDSWEIRVLGERLTTELVQFFLGTHSYPRSFRDSLVEDAFKPDNADLRPLAALPFEECIARVLCAYNYNGKLGDRRDIFFFAERRCHFLLCEGKSDDVTRILSHVNRLDIVKSYIQHPYGIYSDVVEFIVKDHKHQILYLLNEFVKTVDQSRLGPRSLSQVFSVLASPPPTDIDLQVDLSPLVDYLCRHPDYSTWREISNAIIAYLTPFDLSQISDSSAVRRFLERCIDFYLREETGRRYLTNNDTGARAHNLLTELNSISPPTGAIAYVYTANH